MKIKTGLIFVVLLSLTVFAGCSEFQNDSEKESEALVLRSYIVPDGMAKEISETINDLLSRETRKMDNDQPPIGKARIAPDGQILVAAPESFHIGIQEFIFRVANTIPKPSLSTEVNYWIVAGRKAKTRAKVDEFTGIQPALDTIQNNQGNMEFKLLDHVVTTSSGQGVHSQVSGDLSRISQQLTADSKGILVIETNIGINNGSRWNNNISTQVEIKNGELVVLGQASQQFRGISIFNPIKEEEKEKNKRQIYNEFGIADGHVELVNVYYIISATVKK